VEVEASSDLVRQSKEKIIKDLSPITDDKKGRLFHLINFVCVVSFFPFLSIMINKF
jgi:hypothetical protein